MLTKCSLNGLFTLVLLLVLSSDVLSQTYWSLASGQWSTTSATGPSCGCSPGGGGNNIIVNHNISITAANFTIGNGGSLTINAGRLTINGNLTFNNGSNIRVEENAFLSVTGNFENKNNSDNVTFNGSISIGGNFRNGTGGSNTAVIDFGPNATISIGGTCANAGSVNQSGNTFSGSPCGGPLPVQLIFFRAAQQHSEVHLTWATASEKGFEYFGIERADETLQWMEIAQVKGSGDSKVRIDYSYIDQELHVVGKTYYRLKAVDFDGYTEYFNVAFVDFKGAKAWSVTPNPAQGGHVVLTRNFSDDQTVTATVYSVSGTQMFSEKISFMSNQHVLDTDLKSGMYVLTVRTGNHSSHLRFVVK